MELRQAILRLRSLLSAPVPPVSSPSLVSIAMKPLLTLISCVALSQIAMAQLLDAPVTEGDPERMGKEQVVLFRVGAEITASRGACRDIRAMVAVPLACAEQQVRMVEEEFTRHLDKVTYRDLDDGVRQMLITIPRLSGGETARAVVTYEVTTNTIEPPEQESTEDLELPKRPERKIRKYLTESPMIEVRDGAIRSLARDLWREAGEQFGSDATDNDAEPNAWSRVEYLYDYMLDNIQYSEGPDKSALDTLRDGKADCHGRSALFIALCRANKVPARVVWVNEHCYAEFYLEDAEGQGHWYPIESAGTRAFGGMPLARPILQKGDNFKVPERRGERLFYATDDLVAYPVGNSGKPSVKFIRELVE